LEVIKLISAGQPIRLDNRNVSHLKYGECGYQKYGIGMVRRLFPILSYKTKLMVAQWIVAERLIVPIKVVKVGSDERPAGPADIAAVQSQLAATANDANLTIVTHHAFDIDWSDVASRMGNNIKKAFKEIIKGIWNTMIDGIGWVLKGVSQFIQDNPFFAQILFGGNAQLLGNAGFRDAIDRKTNEFKATDRDLNAVIPTFAEGTNWFKGGTALVGEKGPELVNLPRGSSVIPNHRMGGQGASIVNNNYFSNGLDIDTFNDKMNLQFKIS
jgi:hypothetical protein